MSTNPLPTPETSSCLVGSGLTVGFHPRIAPSSVANRNRAGPLTPPLLTAKSPVPLNTVPVGVPVKGPVSASPGAGIATVRPSFVPAPVYSVDTLAPLSETQIGLDELAESPHGFFRFGSVT